VRLSVAAPRLDPPQKFKKPAAPKLVRLAIHPAGNGAAVTHHFQEPHRARMFVFHDPAKMVSHLNRAIRSERWHPNANPAPRILRDINLG
jgi:hypothetical protein